MQNDDEVRDETSSEPKIVRQGRRATYTPPPRRPSTGHHDDEELETALSAGLAWLSTGAIPTTPTPEVVQAPSEASEPEAPAADPADEPVVVAPLWESAPPPSTPAAPAAFDEDDDDAVDDPAPAPAEQIDESPAPPTWAIDDPEPAFDSEPGVPSETPPWASLPAPDPAQAVYLPSGPEFSAPPAPEEEPAFETIPWEPRAWEPEVVEVPEPVAVEPEAVETPAPVAVEPEWSVEPEQVDEPEAVGAWSEPADISEPVATITSEVEVDEPLTPDVSVEPIDSDAPELPFAPPVRQSLADEELASLVDDPAAREGGTLGLIEQFEQQLKLREQEAQKFSEWENSMLSLGTDDAVSEVESVRTQFTGVIPIIPPTAPPEVAEATAPVEAEPVEDAASVDEAGFAEEPAPVEDAVDESEPEADAQPEPAVPAAWPSWASVSAPAAPSESEAEVPEATLDGDSTDESDLPEETPAEETAAEEAVSAEVTSDEAPAAETLVDEAPVDAPTVDDGATDDEQTPEDQAPWWLDEPVAEGIIAEPTGVIEVAEPILEPELLEADEPADDIVEAEVVEEPEEESLPQLPAGIEPEPESEAPAPPFEPPALIEPPGYGAPAPSVDDEPLSSFTALPGDTGEVIVAEVIDSENAGQDAAPEAAAAGFVFDAAGAGARAVPSPDADPEFEEILNGNLEEEPPQRYDPEPVTEQDASAEPLFIEPMPVSAGRDVPTDTGSVSIIDRAYEEELDDDVDDTDRAFGPVIGGIAVSAAGTTEVSPPFSPPSEPISIVRLRDDEVVIANNEPIQTPVFSIEQSGPEPTPVDRRVGHAARLFWLWFAANSSILSVALGAVIYGLGMSLRQSIVAILIGVAISFIPLGLSSLAGKRSGQPTMIVSRATFGVLGNILPSAIALLTRLFWGAVLLWLLASSVAIVLVGADASGALGDRQVQIISLAVAFVVALLVAFAGYPLLARIQLILSIVSAVLIFGLIILTVSHVNFDAALGTPDGPWILVITGAVLVFSFVGLVWAHSGADLARYQRPNSSGASSMLWSTFGATLPAFLLIGYGALLAASDRGMAEGFATAPLETLSTILPGWYPIPLILATALSLLSGVVVTMYSGGFALQSIGVRLSRQWSTVVVGVAVVLLALVFTFAVSGGITDLFRDLATTLAVPTAAWAGIFAAETMIRNRRFESPSLLARGGLYPDVRWTNFIGLIVVSVIGWGLTTATVAWLGWQGYLFGLLGAPIDGDFAGTDIGVLVALVLGLLLPIVAGIPAIRRQEDTRV